MGLAWENVAAMASPIGGPMRWSKCISPHEPKGEDKKPFCGWLYGRGHEIPYEINCREVVLFPTWMAGEVDREYITRVIRFE